MENPYDFGQEGDHESHLDSDDEGLMGGAFDENLGLSDDELLLMGEETMNAANVENVPMGASEDDAALAFLQETRDPVGTTDAQQLATESPSNAKKSVSPFHMDLDLGNNTVSGAGSAILAVNSPLKATADTAALQTAQEDTEKQENEEVQLTPRRSESPEYFRNTAPGNSDARPSSSGSGSRRTAPRTGDSSPLHKSLPNPALAPSNPPLEEEPLDYERINLPGDNMNTGGQAGTTEDDFEGDGEESDEDWYDEDDVEREVLGGTDPDGPQYHSERDTAVIKAGGTNLTLAQAKLYGLYKNGKVEVPRKEKKGLSAEETNRFLSSATSQNKSKIAERHRRKIQDELEREKKDACFRPQKSAEAERAMKNSRCGYDFVSRIKDRGEFLDRALDKVEHKTNYRDLERIREERAALAAGPKVDFKSFQSKLRANEARREAKLSQLNEDVHGYKPFKARPAPRNPMREGPVVYIEKGPVVYIEKNSGVLQPSSASVGKPRPSDHGSSDQHRHKEAKESRGREAKQTQQMPTPSSTGTQKASISVAPGRVSTRRPPSVPSTTENKRPKDRTGNAATGTKSKSQNSTKPSARTSARAKSGSREPAQSRSSPSAPRGSDDEMELKMRNLLTVEDFGD
jgi:hypothetical protein